MGGGKGFFGGGGGEREKGARVPNGGGGEGFPRGPGENFFQSYFNPPQKPGGHPTNMI